MAMAAPIHSYTSRFAGEVAMTADTILLRRASFPEDSASVSSLLSSYHLQTESEKVERGLVPAYKSLPERQRYVCTLDT